MPDSPDPPPRVEAVEKVLTNPWDNVYWFARSLINSDVYGGPGTNSPLMAALSAGIRETIEVIKNEAEPQAVSILVEMVCKLILQRHRDNSTKAYQLSSAFCDFLRERLQTLRDIEVFALTCERVMIPINKGLETIPSNDRQFAEAIASSLLTAKREEGLRTVIATWDDLGVNGCLTAERAAVVEAFGALRQYLAGFSDADFDVILSAFAQEFERRISQKRKGRAGRSLENVTSFILRHFGIEAGEVPTHVTTSLELDRIVWCKDDWAIGISCKRTFRERWKQAFTSDMQLLDEHRIKALWHAITFDRDLSEHKIQEIGTHRGVVYLPDDSACLRSATANPRLRKFVRPLTHFISDLKHEIG